MINEETKYLEGLNPSQVEAVLMVDGPLLVLAGAGTGKTKVLTSKIAHLILSNAMSPDHILAVTFTNKAAREMKKRLYDILGEAVHHLWIGTFHSISARILRKNAEYLNISPNFVIVSYEEQNKIIKEIMRDLNIKDQLLPKKLLYLIDKAKNSGYYAYNLKENKCLYDKYYLSDFYQIYQDRLSSYNALDFGDLIIRCTKLMQEHPEINEHYKSQFQAILVDEYQDTNMAQYTWLKSLVNQNNNICCVGDDDQSIYGWRGAVIENILRFESDYPAAQIVRLELNYRSTNSILALAMNIIEQNIKRHGKTLRTDCRDGEPVKICATTDEKQEAQYVAMEIKKHIDQYKFSDIAILVRAGHQTRIFEETFNQCKISYQIVGGLKFYDRLEIKDAIAYARIIVNQDDSIAFERIMNTPKRGVGDITLKEIWALCREMNISLFEATKLSINNQTIKGKTAANLNELISQIEYSAEKLGRACSSSEILKDILQDSGYLSMLAKQNNQESTDRIANIKELIQNISEYPGLREFVESVSLVTDSENNIDNDRVNIMTIHASKGLEFAVVFLVGWEDGVFPTMQALYDSKDNNSLEEERRLAYVGITRAKKMLYITRAMCRKQYNGDYQYNPPSCFLRKLDPKNFISLKY